MLEIFVYLMYTIYTFKRLGPNIRDFGNGWEGLGGTPSLPSVATSKAQLPGLISYCCCCMLGLENSDCPDQHTVTSVLTALGSCLLTLGGWVLKPQVVQRPRRWFTPEFPGNQPAG